MNQDDLLDLLDEIRAFLDNQADAEIDAEGKLIGNKAMVLFGRIEQAYEDIERSGVSTD